MKKETIVTGIVFFGVGFLSGYIYDAQKNWNAQQRALSAGGAHVHDETASGAGATNVAPGVASQGLPEGHPPVETAAIVKALEEEAAKNPKSSEPRLKLANFLYDQGQFQRAVEWYQKGLELDPTNVNARTDLGTSYFNIGQPQDALREYQRSLRTNPTHEPTMFNTIVVHLEGSHDLVAAQQAWERLHKQNPNYPGLDSLKRRLETARASASGAPARR